MDYKELKSRFLVNDPKLAGPMVLPVRCRIQKWAKVNGNGDLDPLGSFTKLVEERYEPTPYYVCHLSVQDNLKAKQTYREASFNKEAIAVFLVARTLCDDSANLVFGPSPESEAEVGSNRHTAIFDACVESAMMFNGLAPDIEQPSLTIAKNYLPTVTS